MMNTLRLIQPADNNRIAEIVTQVMLEHGADPKTTIIGDPSLQKMFENYQEEKAVYYVALIEDKIVGGAGIKQLDGSAENICELQRMFLLPEARGQKIGLQLMELCKQKAKQFGYDKIYLESLSQMKSARSLYEKSGFKVIDKPMGNTGHGGCNVFMVLDLK